MSKKQPGLKHDKFFIKVFSVLKNLIDLLRAALSKEDFESIDTNSIKLTKERFITDELHGMQSDMIINVKMNGKPKKIAILIEHKAAYERFTLFQMLKYLVQYWDRERINDKQVLTPITPILFFHGESEWKKERDITMCFEPNLDKKYIKFIPKFDYVLFDLNKVNVEEIEGNIEFKCAMILMKNVHKNLLKALNTVTKMIEEFVKDKALGNLRDFVIFMLNYVKDSDKVKPKDIDKVIDRITNSELKEVFMTLEQELELRGMEKGMEKGRKEGILKTAKNLKNIGIDVDKIAKATGLTKEEIEKL